MRQLPPREVESRAIHSHKLLPGQPTRAYPLTRPIHPHAHTLPTSRVEFTRVHRLTPPWFAPTTGGVFGALVRVAGVRIHSSGVGDWRIAVSWFFKVVRLNNIRHGGGQSPTMRAALDSSRCIFANSDSARHMHHPLPRHQGEEGSRGDMWGAGVETTSAWGLRHIYTTDCVREDELHTCPVWEPPQHPSRATGDADKGARWKTAWRGLAPQSRNGWFRAGRVSRVSVPIRQRRDSKQSHLRTDASHRGTQGSLCCRARACYQQSAGAMGGH